MFCANGGALIDEEAKFCLICGESLTEGPREENDFGTGWFKKMKIFKKLDPAHSLSNLAFHKFSAPKKMKFLYGGSILSAGLINFVLVLLAFHASTRLGIFTLLIVVPLLFLLTVAYSGVLLEMVFMMDRMAGQTKDLTKKVDSSDPIRWNID
jgi:hypothetical protein